MSGLGYADLLRALDAIRNRMIDRGDYVTNEWADVVDATTIGEAMKAIESLATPAAIPVAVRDIPREGEAKDAARYRWLRTRINWEDTVNAVGALTTYQREWTHIDMRPCDERPESEHIDEYIDGQLDTAMSQERG